MRRARQLCRPWRWLGPAWAVSPSSIAITSSRETCSGNSFRRIRRRRRAAQGRRGRAASGACKFCDSRLRDWSPISILRTAEELLDGVDLILDGTDNFETRYLINDYSVSHLVPWIYGAAVGSYGLTMPVIPGRHQLPALRVYPHPPAGAQPTCETAGVLNALTGVIAVAASGRRSENPFRRIPSALPGASPRSMCGRVAFGRSSSRPAMTECPGVRSSRFRVPRRRAACAHQPVRTQRRADSRARPAHRSRGIEETAAAAR